MSQKRNGLWVCFVLTETEISQRNQNSCFVVTLNERHFVFCQISNYDPIRIRKLFKIFLTLPPFRMVPQFFSLANYYNISLGKEWRARTNYLQHIRTTLQTHFCKQFSHKNVVILILKGSDFETAYL